MKHNSRGDSFLNTHNIAIIGLGYVGLPLALLAGEKYPVIGVDSVREKIDILQTGKSYIDDISDSQIVDTHVSFTDDIAEAADCTTFIICVPTPVSEDKIPDLTPLKSAATSLRPVLKQGDLIIVESTINPGVCDEVVIPLIEEVSGLTVGTDIHIAHCPERINPGDKQWNVSNINRVIGSNSEEGLNRSYEFYDSIIDADIKKMGSLKEAEAVKVVENSFRDINIAFVNELAISFHKLGINLENVIDGASTKPFAFMPHHPSIGVGGHCIPVDPYYLIEYASSFGFNHRFLSLAREINENMPAFTLSLLQEAKQEASVSSMSATVLGLSYKANVADKRESPALKFISLLESAGYDVTTHDPFFPAESTTDNLSTAIEQSEIVVLASNHSEFLQITPELLREKGVRIFIDGKNMFKNAAYEFQDHGIEYRGIGVH